MGTMLAWRLLLHSKVNAFLAVAGATLAILLMFLQLGFYGSVLSGATQIYDQLDFDLILVSREYSYLARPGVFPRRRIYQAQRLAAVESASPFYVGYEHWVDGRSRTRRAIFVMAFPLHHSVFLTPEVQQLTKVLNQPDTVAVDRHTRTVFGPQRMGRVVEVGKREVKLVGQYTIGTGFIELGSILVSDQNFIRIFAGRSLDEVSLGLIKLRPGADAGFEARKLQELLSDDVDVLTRDEFMSDEQRYWVVNTSTGMVFGFGVLVAFLVGTVILYQTLSNQIIRQLPNLATMKAMGYTDRYLSLLIVESAVLLVVVGFIPGLLGSFILYGMISESVHLPIFMTLSRAVFVFGLAMTMSVVSSLLSLRKLHLADPADLM